MASGAPPRPVQVKTQESVGLGFELDGTEADVLEVVKLVAEDPIIRGTYVYESTKTLTGARPANSSAYFGAWTGPGACFYKVSHRGGGSAQFQGQWRCRNDYGPLCRARAG